MEENKNKIAIEQPNSTYYVKNGIKFKTGDVYFEPKLSRGFIVQMGSGEFPSFVINKIDRPSYMVGCGWKPIVVSMYDPIVPSTTQKAYKLIFNAPKPFVTTIKLFGSVGDIVESWILEDCKITEFSFDTLDWSATDVLQVQLKIEYKNAILEF